MNGMTHLALQISINSQQYNYIAKAHDSAENLLDIIKDSLDFSKLEAGKLVLKKRHFN